jgi:hypothetical protein
MDVVRCAIKRCIVRFMHMKVVEIKIWFVVIDVCYVVTKWRVDVRPWMFFGVNVVKEFKEQGEDAHSPTEIGSLTFSGLTTLRRSTDDSFCPPWMLSSSSKTRIHMTHGEST